VLPFDRASDAVNGVVPKADVPATPAYSSEAAIGIIKTLDVTRAFQLRKVVADILEERRDSRSTG
jgi:hypothetical protein